MGIITTTSLGKMISLLLIVMILTIPIIAQQSNPYADAEAQAERDVDKTVWFILGCLGGILGYGAAYLITPNPPTQPLLGKSPEYVAAYTDAYRAKAKKIQTSKAMTGCLVGTAVQVLAIAILVAAAETTDSLYYY